MAKQDTSSLKLATRCVCGSKCKQMRFDKNIKDVAYNVGSYKLMQAVMVTKRHLNRQPGVWAWCFCFVSSEERLWYSIRSSLKLFRRDLACRPVWALIRIAHYLVKSETIKWLSFKWPKFKSRRFIWTSFYRLHRKATWIYQIRKTLAKDSKAHTSEVQNLNSL